jgi:hypothetical protein
MRAARTGTKIQWVNEAAEADVERPERSRYSAFLAAPTARPL